MKRLDARQTLAGGAGLVTVTLTAAAFWLSYEHLHDVADDNGLDGARAWAWPGTVDLFIVAGELLILRAALRGKADWFAYLLAGVGSLGSIALNVAGVGTGADPLEYIVAAVPPVAALLAFAAVMRQVHERLAGRVELVGVADEYAETVEVERVPEVYPAIEVRVPEVPEAVPPGARLLPLVARPDHPRGASRKVDEVPVPEPVPAPQVPVPEEQVHPEPHPLHDLFIGRGKEPEEPEDDPVYPDPLIPQVRADFPDEAPGVRRLKEQYGIGQVRAQRIRDELMGVRS